MSSLPEVTSLQVHRAPRWRAYGSLLKSLQTGLLVLTGVAGLSSAHGLSAGPGMWSGLIVSLLLAIGGSTVLNMVYDRDIDRRMQRTCSRPLPQGVVSVREAVVLGSLLTGSGVLLAFNLSTLYGALIAAGVFTDLVVYTLWLKRRSPWSIVWGGIAGAMPIVAGRALGMGMIDGPAVALGLSVLLWIPTHILTFNLRYEEDYRRAGVPTIPRVYGPRTARRLISASSLLGRAISVCWRCWGWAFSPWRPAARYARQPGSTSRCSSRPRPSCSAAW
jgi:protoheme IX farnesyltransferase